MWKSKSYIDILFKKKGISLFPQHLILATNDKNDLSSSCKQEFQRLTIFLHKEVLKKWAVLDDEIVPFRFLHLYICTKGQLISKYPFGVFKSPKKNKGFLPFSLKRGQFKKVV